MPIARTRMAIPKIQPRFGDAVRIVAGIARVVNPSLLAAVSRRLVFAETIRSEPFAWGVTLFGAASEASGGNIFLPTSGPSCLVRSKEFMNVWRCPEPAGYVVEFANEGNIVGIGFAKGPLRGPQIEVDG
jgi:hypothetical protein